MSHSATPLCHYLLPRALPSMLTLQNLSAAAVQFQNVTASCQPDQFKPSFTVALVARPKSPLTTFLHPHITTLTYVDVIYLSEHRVALRQVAVGARPHGAQNTLTDALPQGRHFVGGVVQLLGEFLQRTLPERVRHQPVPTKPENRANVPVYKQKLPIIDEPHLVSSVTSSRNPMS